MLLPERLQAPHIKVMQSHQLLHFLLEPPSALSPEVTNIHYDYYYLICYMYVYVCI